MSYIKERVAYLRGLAEGMELGDNKEGKLLNAIIATLDEMADSIDDNEASIIELDECVDDLYDSVEGLEDCIFDDDEDDDEDYIEVECPSCGETIYFDHSMLEEDDDLICPNCNASVLPDPGDE